MTPAEDACELASTFPSIDLAYPIAVAAYEATAKRLDAVDGRLQSILAFATVLFVAVVAGANANHADFTSRWFYLAALFFAASATYGIYARLKGAPQVLDPSSLFADWLDKPDAVFKKDMIFYAGEAFTYNKELADYKWRVAVRCSLAFLAQGAFLVAWLVQLGL